MIVAQKIIFSKGVNAIIVNPKTLKANGIVLETGEEITANVVLSNATPYVTYNKLLPNEIMSDEHLKITKNFDYSSPVAKINGNNYRSNNSS